MYGELRQRNVRFGSLNLKKKNTMERENAKTPISVSCKRRIVIEDWMFERMKLNAKEALIFATLYSYTKSGRKMFIGTVGELAEFSYTSHGQVSETVNRLIGGGFVFREKCRSYGRSSFCYKVNLDKIESLFSERYPKRFVKP